jgi:hypothetical protein
MRAPPSKRDDAEIISDIIKACKDKPSQEEVALKIAQLRERMKGSPWAGFRTTNREYVAKLRTCMGRLDELRRKMPKDFNPFMLFMSDEGSLQGAEERADVFWGNMEWFRQRLDKLANADLGVHGNKVFQQDWAAIAARELCEQHGLPLAYTSPTSAYSKTADLLFEAVTGKRQRQERACEAMAKVPILDQDTN